MGYRVVDKSSFTFETDLPPSSRDIHPSGVLHAFRSTVPAASSTLIKTNASGREEHTFAWINDSLHADEAIKQLEKFGFDNSNGIAFIPYSTKQNWLDRYPHAAPALETKESGEVVLYLKRRPYPNGLAELGERVNYFCAEDAEPTPNAEEADGIEKCNNKACTTGEGDNTNTNNENASNKKGRRVHKSRDKNILRDNTFLADAERDELHIEIYNYFKWLHSKLSALERKVEEGASKDKTSMAANAGAVEADIDEVVVGENDNSKPGSNITSKKKKYLFPGVDLSEMQGILTKLESTFIIIQNAKLEEEGGEEAAGAGVPQGAPFLEEALSDPLSQLVVAREVAGKPKRRSRKRPQRKGNGPPGINRQGLDWDEMFQKLVKYKEVHGDCMVSRNYKEDPVLANWVHRVRKKKSKLQKDGIEVEAVPPGKKLFAKTLTAERLAQLNSLEFVWTPQGPRTAWDNRFQELMEYYAENGKWPTQSMGTLGEWVNKQRMKYKRGDKQFLATDARKLDDVGFEWTPRGNAIISWDEGFEKLMEFHRQNGHFDVPCPDGPDVDRKGDAYKFYKFVQSLHVMYRSYKIGRQSGVLTDERVVLLIKHGFEFQNNFN